MRENNREKRNHSTGVRISLIYITSMYKSSTKETCWSQERAYDHSDNNYCHTSTTPSFHIHPNLFAMKSKILTRTRVYSTSSQRLPPIRFAFRRSFVINVRWWNSRSSSSSNSNCYPFYEKCSWPAAQTWTNLDIGWVAFSFFFFGPEGRTHWLLLPPMLLHVLLCLIMCIWCVVLCAPAILLLLLVQVLQLEGH